MKYLALIGAMGVSLLLASPASASPVKSTITLSGTLAFGEQITVTTTTSGAKQFAYEITQLYCFQDGVLVGVGLGAIHLNDGGAYQDTYSLGPSDSWQSGAASCEMRVFVESADFKRVKMETVYSFAVAP